MQWLAQDVEHLVSLSQAADNPYCPDVVVVGSGYGGAVAALRFAEHGQNVALLERGNEYLAGEFPSDLSQTGGFIRAELNASGGANAVGNEDALFDFRLGQRASALVGNGLGGGSLINAAVALRPDPRVFAHSPWPEAIRQADLDQDFQRAGAGLIVSEASQVSPQGKGYMQTPGIYSAAQVAGWKPVTAAVHEAGGRIAIQLWHVGRISHTSLQPDGQAPVSASALAAHTRTSVLGEGGKPERVPCSTPRPLETGEIPALLESYADATRNAREAGFDLVEVHAAHGYLLQQFQAVESNQRDDAYGGSVENRARFLLEVVAAVAEEVGAVAVEQQHHGDVLAILVGGAVNGGEGHKALVHAGDALRERAVPQEITTRTVVLSGTVGKSLFASARKAGLGSAQLNQLTAF